jgi:hypothetical protein
MNALDEQIKVDQILPYLIDRKVDQHAGNFGCSELTDCACDEGIDRCTYLILVDRVFRQNGRQNLGSSLVELVAHRILRRNKGQNWSHRNGRLVHCWRHWSLLKMLIASSWLLEVLLLAMITTSTALLGPIWLHLLIPALVSELALSSRYTWFIRMNSSQLVCLTADSSHQRAKNSMKLLVVLKPKRVAVNACLVGLEILLIHHLLVLNHTLLFDLIVVNVERSTLQRKISCLSQTCTVWCREAHKCISMSSKGHTFFLFLGRLRWIENFEGLNLTKVAEDSF